MKNTRKVFAVIFAVVMMLTMTTSAFAATITNQSGLDHDYYAYQIFTGTQDGDGTLGDIQWGDGVHKTAILSDENLKKISGFEDVTTSTTAAEIAAILETKVSDSEDTKAFAKIVYAHRSETKTALDSGDTVDLASGYYLVVDESDLSGAVDDANNLAILQLTDSITIKDKTGIPTVEKKVYENSLQAYNDVADYAIGDNVPFKLTATLPKNVKDYDSYKLIFHDTMDKGLTFNNDAKVYVNGIEVSEDCYTVTTGIDRFDVTISDVFALKNTSGESIAVSKDSVITVEYTAELNKEAIIGGVGNENHVYLEYSNNPNIDSIGKTTEDTVVVFTYELDIYKVNSDKEPLEGVEFKLANADGYYLQLDENGFVIGWGDEDSATVFVTDADGKIYIKGLDEGEYSLYETKALTGYNTPTSAFAVVISASTGVVNNYTKGDGANILTTLTVELNGNSDEVAPVDVSSGKITITIENSKGSLLPETGGIGTTIFYIAGIAIVAAAVVLLIIKKKNNGAAEAE